MNAQPNVAGNDLLLWLLVLVAGLIILLFGFVFLLLLARPWIRAAASGCPVSLLSILGMRLRGSPPSLVVDAYIALRRSGVNATIADVEGVYIDKRTRVRSRDDLVALVTDSVASRQATTHAESRAGAPRAP